MKTTHDGQPVQVGDYWLFTEPRDPPRVVVIHEITDRGGFGAVEPDGAIAFINLSSLRKGRMAIRRMKRSGSGACCKHLGRTPDEAARALREKGVGHLARNLDATRLALALARESRS